MELSILSICLGLGVAALNLFGVVKPAEFAAAARKVPRSLPLGYVSISIGVGSFPLDGAEPFLPCHGCDLVVSISVLI